MLDGLLALEEVGFEVGFEVGAEVGITVLAETLPMKMDMAARLSFMVSIVSTGCEKHCCWIRG